MTEICDRDLEVLPLGDLVELLNQLLEATRCAPAAARAAPATGSVFSVVMDSRPLSPDGTGLLRARVDMKSVTPVWSQNLGHKIWSQNLAWI
jgi:hypothetical protein